MRNTLGHILDTNSSGGLGALLLLKTTMNEVEQKSANKKNAYKAQVCD